MTHHEIHPLQTLFSQPRMARQTVSHPALHKVCRLDVGRLIRRIRPQKPATDAPVFAHYVWGFSNSQSDIDNPVKPFQDVLFDTWQMKSKDHQVQFMIVEKTKTKKGQEFIGFHVDAKANLIEYLENVLARLKAEKESKA